jgi:hypothetical protein
LRQPRDGLPFRDVIYAAELLNSRVQKLILKR